MIDLHVYNTVAEALSLDSADFKPTMNLRTDLYASEMWITMIYQFLNDDYDFAEKITPEEAREWSTIADIIDAVKRRME